jgi:hypothetical protein
LQRTIPVLRIFDEHKAKEFYVDYLGSNWTGKITSSLTHELPAKRYKYFRQVIHDAPWNAKVMALVDAFGNRIRFNQYTPHNVDNMQQDSSQSKKQPSQHDRRSRRRRAARRRSRA